MRYHEGPLGRSRPTTIVLLVAAALLAGLLGSATPAGAGSSDLYLQVTNGANSGTGTWRAAIDAAGASAADEVVVTFDDGIRVELTGDPVVYDGDAFLNVRGRGATIDSNDETVALEVVGAADVEVEALTFVDGRNEASNGGAINVGGGGLRAFDVSFVGNEAVNGGAIAVGADGSVEVVRGLFEDNTAFGDPMVTGDGDGGAIWVDDGYAEVERTTLDGNEAERDGGAIAGIESLLIAYESTFVGNVAADVGGAIASGFDAEVQTYNSTFTGGHADEGAAIFDESGIAFLNTSSFVDNTALVGSHVSAEQLNSIQNVFAGSFGGGESCELLNTTTDEYSWDDGESCGFDPLGSSTSNGGSADLGALDDHGGPTPTYLPHPLSPLVDAIPAVDCEAARDQRGVDRPAGDGCDIGAVEAVGQTFTDVGFAHPFWLEVEWMAEEGISEGYEPGPTYKPSAAVTRQAMSAFLYRLAGEPAFTPPPSPTFGDVGVSHPFFAEVEWMAAESISEGTPGSPKPTYKPGAAVSRQAMSAFLYRFSGDDFDATSQSFVDVSGSHPFYEAVEWMAEFVISEGYEVPAGREYRPSAAVSRQAMSAFMYRYAHLE